MAFLINDTKDGAPGPWEYLEASALGACKVGMALTLTDGKLAKATATVRPSYISMFEGTVVAGDRIPVIRVLPDMIWETAAQAALTSIKLGDKVTLHTDGMQVTATKTNGVAEVVDMDGTNVGSRVLVRFNAPATVVQQG